MSNVLILALPKSGTTLMYQMVLNSWTGEGLGLFEPDFVNPPRPEEYVGRRVCSKVLLHQARGREYYGPENSDFFSRKIMLVRDPRDVLVSLFLYLFYHSTVFTDFGSFARLMAALKAKEADPQSISFLDLIRLRDRLENNRFPGPTLWTLGEMEFSRRVMEDHRHGFFLLKYEDLVDRRLSGLEDYLGFTLPATDEVDPRYKRVERTKKYGDWRNWFLGEDVDFFRPRLKSYMEEFSFADDWDLPEDPVLSPAHGSEYVISLARRSKCFKTIDYGPESFVARFDPAGRPGDELPITGLAARKGAAHPPRGAEITNLRVENPDGRPVRVLQNGREYICRFEAVFRQRARNVNFVWSLRPSGARNGPEADTASSQGLLAEVEPGRTVRVSFPFVARLKPEVYFVSAMVREEGGGFFNLRHYLTDEYWVLVPADSGEETDRPPTVEIVP